MTKERRIVFDVRDLKVLRVRCLSCEREVLANLSGKRYEFPQMCPICKAVWSAVRGLPEKLRPRRTLEETLVDVVQLILDPDIRNRCKPAVRILFEMDDEGPDRSRLQN